MLYFYSTTAQKKTHTSPYLQNHLIFIKMRSNHINWMLENHFWPKNSSVKWLWLTYSLLWVDHSNTMPVVNSIISMKPTKTLKKSSIGDLVFSCKLMYSTQLNSIPCCVCPIFSLIYVSADQWWPHTRFNIQTSLSIFCPLCSVILFPSNRDSESDEIKYRENERMQEVNR